MRLRAVCLALAAPLLLAGAAFAAEKDRDMQEGKKPDKPLSRLVPAGSLPGTLQSAGGSSGLLRLRVPIRRIEPNVQAQANLIQQQQTWLRRQVEILRNPNPIQRRQQMIELVRDVQQARQNLFTIRDSHIDVDLVADDELKVRVLRPSPTFDDMGNIEKLTREKLKELKGKENLPGYTAAREDLQDGQTVLMYLARERANKDPQAKPLASVIVILAEPRR
jgi:hypothetical protein